METGKMTVRFLNVALFIVVVLSLSMQVLCQDHPPDIAKILEKGTITVGAVKNDIYPFYIHDSNGKLTGLDVELAYDLASRLGVKVEFIRTAETYDDVVEMVARGEADISLSYLSRTLSREIKIRFSDPYITLNQALLANRIKLAGFTQNGMDPSEVMNQNKIKIATLKGSAYAEYAKSGFPKAEILLYKSTDEILKGLRKGDFLAVLLDTNSLHNWKNEYPQDVIFYSPDVLEDKKDCLAIAVQWQETHLLRWLNLYIQKIKHDGTLTKLMEKYMPW